MFRAFDLSGKTAVVTGGGRGLGAAMSLALAQAGANVVVTGRDTMRLQDSVRQIKESGGRASHCVCDITSRDQIEAMVAQVTSIFGGIDILVNNAGITARSAFVDIQDDDWQTMMQTHVSGPFMTSRAVLPGMYARGAGKIINTVSVVGELGRPWVVSYSTAKGALRMLTRALATEVADRNIQVNGIGPGYFNTDMNDALIKDAAFYHERVQRVPAKRWGEPDELGGVAVFLASGASSYVNGQIIYVDGGLSASF